MTAAAFFRLKKLKGRGIVLVAARHNRRAVQAEVGASASIDPTRSHLNETLHGPPTAEKVSQLASARLTDAGIGKLRRDAVMALEMVFSLPSGHGIEERRFFLDCVRWAGMTFGGLDNVLSADVHRDEAQPHCHVLVQPLLDGKMIGSDLVGNARKLRHLQQDFHASVAAAYGLRKAPARLVGAAKQHAAGAVLSALRSGSDAALESAAWPTIRDAIESDPAPFAQQLGIELAAPKAKLRTMAQIFTSRGKGPRFEKPIGFADRPARASLCSVGFAPAQAAPTGDASAAIAFTREREIDLNPAHYDAVTGEFRQPAPLRKVARLLAGEPSDDLGDMVDCSGQ